jgi:hypothetical protein
VIQAAAIGEFTSLDGIEWRSLSERALDKLENEPKKLDTALDV